MSKFDMDEEYEELDFVQEHKRIPCTLTVMNNSGDCVSRQYLIDKINSVDGLEGIENSNLFAKHYMDIVKNAPSVQPTRPTGKWVYKMQVMNNPYTYQCSVCKGWERDKTKYCPYCGAKMEVEE